MKLYLSNKFNVKSNSNVNNLYENKNSDKTQEEEKKKKRHVRLRKREKERERERETPVRTLSPLLKVLTITTSKPYNLTSL